MASESRSASSFICNNCNKHFTIKQSLLRHIKLKRCKTAPVCAVCPKKFDCHSKLMRHLNANPSHHPNFETSAETERETSLLISQNKIRCLEPGCSIYFHRLQTLQDHLTSCHNMQFEEEERVFQNEMEFEEWKTNIERLHYVSFLVVQTGNGSRYYTCNRSGTYTSSSGKLKPCQRKRAKSCKSGHSCTARVVKRNLEDGRIIAKCCKTHYGHDIELLRLNLPTSMREKLKVMKRFYAGAKQKTIVKKIGECEIRVPEEQSMCILKAIQSLERSAAMYTHERHTDDAVSVGIFVNEMLEQQEKNPILACKLQGNAQVLNIDCLEEEDMFVVIMHPIQVKMFTKFGSNIVCVDATQGFKGYKFQLITVLVVDEYGEGFPVAWCLSNKKDNNILTQFFNKIKDKAGRITPQMFMSDDDAHYYIAFKHVFGCEPKKVLCSWQVDKAWRRKLSLIRDENVLFEVYATLVSLRDETEESVFRCGFQEFLQKLHDQSVTQDFARFFEQEYSHRYQEWALCFRAADISATNKNVDAAFKIMKYAYSLGKKNKRVDRFISILLRYINDRGFDRLNKIMKGKHTSGIVKIHRRHKASLSLKLEDVIVEGDNSYLVRSGFKTYSVKLTSDKCPDSCRIRCEHCKICVHTIYCDCPDSFIKCVICKHCHLVIRCREEARHNGDQVLEQEYIPVSPSWEEEQILATNQIIDSLGTHCYTSTAVSAEHQSIKDQLTEIQARVQELSNPDGLQYIHNSLKTVLDDIRIYKEYEGTASWSLCLPHHLRETGNNSAQQRSFSSAEQKKVLNFKHAARPAAVGIRVATFKLPPGGGISVGTADCGEHSYAVLKSGL